ncbi:MAG: S-layer homology domain-containing protein, partial [Clostridiales bacterium]|nr:S-layer homology domain-containing protein [Clostridiales bacterium]
TTYRLYFDVTPPADQSWQTMTAPGGLKLKYLPDVSIRLFDTAGNRYSCFETKLVYGEEGVADGTLRVGFKFNPKLGGEVLTSFTLTELTVTGIERPAVGAHPSISKLDFSSGAFESAFWFDVDNNWISSDQTFEGGKIYKLVLSAVPNAPFRWACAYQDGKALPTVSAVNIRLFGDDSTEYGYQEVGILNDGTLVVVAYFICTEPSGKGQMDYVEICPLEDVIPVAGAKPNFQDYLVTNGAAPWAATWYDQTDNKDLTADDAFIGGHSYLLSFYIMPDPAAEWKTKQDGTPDVSAILTVGEGMPSEYTSFSYESSGTKLLATYLFSCPLPPTKEQSVAAVFGVTAPKAGEFPSFVGVGSIGGMVDAIGWYDITDERDMLVHDKFVEGHAYDCTVFLLPPDGSVWATNGTKSAVLATMNVAGTDYSEPAVTVRGYEKNGVETVGVSKTWELKPAESGTDKPAETIPAPTITTHPFSVTAKEGDTIQFSVDALGEDLVYQWAAQPSKGDVAWLSDSASDKTSDVVAGVNSKTLTIKNISQTYSGCSFFCLVATKKGYEQVGYQVSTNYAVLTVSKPVAVQKIVFKDVPESEWYYSWVYEAVDLGLINGKGKDTDGKDYFDPKGEMTFAQAAKLAACMHELSTTGKITLANGTQNWYDTYVEYCRDNGIFLKSGEQGGITWEAASQHANDAVTRKEFAWIFSRALSSENLAVKNNIPDESIPDVGDMTSVWYAGIYTLYRAGILNGSDDKGTFNPEAYISRAEVSAIVVRMMTPARRVDAPKDLPV